MQPQLDRQHGADNAAMPCYCQPRAADQGDKVSTTPFNGGLQGKPLISKTSIFVKNEAQATCRITT